MPAVPRGHLPLLYLCGGHTWQTMSHSSPGQGSRASSPESAVALGAPCPAPGASARTGSGQAGGWRRELSAQRRPEAKLHGACRRKASPKGMRRPRRCREPEARLRTPGEEKHEGRARGQSDAGPGRGAHRGQAALGLLTAPAQEAHLTAPPGLRAARQDEQERRLREEPPSARSRTAFPRLPAAQCKAHPLYPTNKRRCCPESHRAAAVRGALAKRADPTCVHATFPELRSNSRGAVPPSSSATLRSQTQSAAVPHQWWREL